MSEIKILGIVGSLRKNSYNRFALKAAHELLAEGAMLGLVELHGIPIYDQGTELTPPPAAMGVSIGSLGTARAQYHLRQILVALDMPTVNQPEVMIGNAERRFTEDGKLTDEPTRKQIQKLLLALIALVKSSRGD